MKVIWSNRAADAAAVIGEYIFQSFGYSTFSYYRKAIAQAEELLLANPFIGPEEALIHNGHHKYHTLLVNRLSKIVYYVEDDVIYIVDFWDTRQDPQRVS